jgi:hypothetical protein
MAASVLKMSRAFQASIYVVRAFMQARHPARTASYED